MSRKVLVCSDFHCGHVIGLTPPGWQWDANDKRDHRRTLAEHQRVYWDFWRHEVVKHGPYDAVILNGDAIDGVGKQGGEHITTDRVEQSDMAIKCLEPAMRGRKPPALIMTYGTGFHTGDQEDFEDVVANFYDSKIGGHEWLDINGVVFDCKHHIGASGIPHGRHTAHAREALWNREWSAAGNCPRADVIVRSHVHYYSGAFGPDWMAMTTPALQGLGSKYGVRRCSGRVDFGFVVFDILKTGSYTWRPILLDHKKIASVPRAI